MVITRKQSLKMADSFCSRVGDTLHVRGMTLQSQVGAMRFLKLTTIVEAREHVGVHVQRQVVVEDFSKWTPENFELFETFVIEELTK
jgi:hypothetical protein